MAAVAAVAMVAAVLAGCAKKTTGDAVSEPAPVAGVDMSGSGPGSLISATTFPSVDASVRSLSSRAVKVTYRSTSGIDGSGTEVTGAVFVPAGQAPPGGWPVMAIAHGTSGILQECSPTATPDLAGSAVLISTYLKIGFAVAFSDYQGLGGPGVHPYLDAKTAGLNVIDSVRALRKVSSTVGSRWSAFGGSQGGGATWAANEQAATYSPELSLVGTVALVPAADMSGLVDRAVAGTLTTDQEAAYIWILNRIAVLYPNLVLDDYRRGEVKDNWDALAVCAGPLASARASALKAAEPDMLKPASKPAADALRKILQGWALPQQKLSAPMTVYYAGADTFIDPAWTRNAIAKACRAGGVILSTFQPDKGHGDVDGTASVQWIGERFTGTTPAPSNCVK